MEENEMKLSWKVYMLTRKEDNYLGILLLNLVLFTVLELIFWAIGLIIGFMLTEISSVSAFWCLVIIIPLRILTFMLQDEINKYINFEKYLL